MSDPTTPVASPFTVPAPAPTSLSAQPAVSDPTTTGSATPPTGTSASDTQLRARIADLESQLTAAQNAEKSYEASHQTPSPAPSGQETATPAPAAATTPTSTSTAKTATPKVGSLVRYTTTDRVTGQTVGGVALLLADDTEGDNPTGLLHLAPLPALLVAAAADVKLEQVE